MKVTTFSPVVHHLDRMKTVPDALVNNVGCLQDR